MKKNLFILSLLFANFAFAQPNNDYVKVKDGLEYKIIRNGGNKILSAGLFLEMHFTNLLSHNGKDSVLQNTRTSGGPQIIPLDSTSFPPVYYKIFTEMNEGDSLTTRTLADSVFKQNQGQMPSFIQSGDYLYTNISIINIYKTKAEADAIEKKNREAAMRAAEAKVKFQAVEDDLLLSNYILENKIKATKLPSGVYVSIDNAGTGTKLSKNYFAKVMYKGKTLKGVVFDTNMNDSKGHSDPLTVNLSDNQGLGNNVIQGMKDALCAMNVGTKGTMYLPSGLAYGTSGAGGDIVPNACLIFDVEVLSAETVAQVIAKKPKPQPDVIQTKPSINTNKTPAKKVTTNKTPVKKVVKKK